MLPLGDVTSCIIVISFFCFLLLLLKISTIFLKYFGMCFTMQIKNIYSIIFYVQELIILFSISVNKWGMITS